MCLPRLEKSCSAIYPRGGGSFCVLFGHQPHAYYFVSKNNVPKLDDGVGLSRVCTRVYSRGPRAYYAQESINSMCHNRSFNRSTSETNATTRCFYFFFYPPADGEKRSFSSPHFHVFSYASCVDLTQWLLQPNASWRTLRVPL